MLIISGGNAAAGKLMLRRKSSSVWRLCPLHTIFLPFLSSRLHVAATFSPHSPSAIMFYLSFPPLSVCTTSKVLRAHTWYPQEAHLPRLAISLSAPGAASFPPWCSLLVLLLTPFSSLFVSFSFRVRRLCLYGLFPFGPFGCLYAN